jgi:PIN domain nuclease of toxin-antitoxin system
LNLLLDTHTLLWFVQGSSKMPLIVRSIIDDPQNEVSVSIASYWEIGIKQRLKKDVLWTGTIPALENIVTSRGMHTIPITVAAIEMTKVLGSENRDPFDRIIAASAITLSARLVSADSKMDQFVPDRLW